MQSCHRCQAENSEIRRFCGNCGARIGAPCLQCGFSNATDDKFCGGCGRAVSDLPLDSTASSGAKVPETDLGMNQLLAEISAEQSQKEENKKFFDASELENLFGEDNPESSNPGT